MLALACEEFGRIPGFTNRKPQYRDAGFLPLVHLIGHSGESFTSATAPARQAAYLRRTLAKAGRWAAYSVRQAYAPRAERPFSFLNNSLCPGRAAHRKVNWPNFRQTRLLVPITIPGQWAACLGV